MQSVLKILKTNYDAERPWSQRPKNSFRCRLIKRIRYILELISGFELTIMLKDLIKPDELKEIAAKYYDGLINLSKPINTVKPKNRYIFYHQLRLANLTLPELKEMNYKISRKLWKSCKNTKERLIGGRSLPEEKVSRIKEILENNSTISSFKTAKIIKRIPSRNVSKFEQTRKALKNMEKKNVEISIENVRLRKISVQDVKDTFDRQCDQTNQSRVSLGWIRNYIKKAKIYKKPQNVIHS